jgi:transketolase
MRTAFVQALSAVAAARRDVVLMTGDLGFGVLDEYRVRFPDQFLNVGVAEQNLAGVAAGLALSGHVVFTYSIGNFPTLRCLEQIRNDICYHRANVKIVTVGGGLAYGALGVSHFATEDLAIMRALPEMTVVSPGDPTEVEQLLPQIVEREGPVYLRLGRAGERRILPADARVSLGQPSIVREGRDVLLLSTGGMLPVAVDAAAALAGEAVSAAVLSVHTVAPLDPGQLLATIARFPVVVTCEEHQSNGGLGGAVAEVLAESRLSPVFRRFALRDGFPVAVGSQDYLRSSSWCARSCGPKPTSARGSPLRRSEVAAAGSFGTAAPEEARYDLVTETTGTPVSREGARMIYSRYRFAAELADGKRVLEVGCGSGQGFGLIGRKARFLVGGDLDPRLLRIGRSHYRNRFPFLRLRAEALPFRDASLDLVLFFEASYYVPNLELALDEFDRVLAAHGTMVLVNANPDRPDFITSPYSHHYHSSDELRGLLEKRGYGVRVEGAFPIEPPGPLSRVMATARRVLERFGLIPRTLRGRALLKRLVYGSLVPLPAELPDGFAEPVERRVHGGGPLPGFKVFYLTARKA